MKRARAIQIKFYVNDDERDIINRKLALTKISSRGHFILKCILEKPIINLDLKEIREHSMEMGKVGNNINQIIKKANSTDIVFLEELQEIKSLMRDLVKSEKELLKTFRSLI